MAEVQYLVRQDDCLIYPEFPDRWFEKRDPLPRISFFIVSICIVVQRFWHLNSYTFLQLS